MITPTQPRRVKDAGYFLTLDKLHEMILLEVMLSNRLKAFINLEKITYIIEHENLERITVFFDDDNVEITTSLEEFTKRIKAVLKQHTNTNK